LAKAASQTTLWASASRGESEGYVHAHPKSAEGRFLLGVQYATTGYLSESHDSFGSAAELTPKVQIVQDLMKGTGAETRAMLSRPNSSTTK
jgi:cytochrome c-type biogenesis protein CcmH/NrfG